MSRLLSRIYSMYGADYVDASALRFWLANSNQTDEDFQAMAEHAGQHPSIARFCRLMCFTSQTQRRLIGAPHPPYNHVPTLSAFLPVWAQRRAP
jgi:hypothetical protein